MAIGAVLVAAGLAGEERLGALLEEVGGVPVACLVVFVVVKECQAVILALGVGVGSLLDTLLWVVVRVVARGGRLVNRGVAAEHAGHKRVVRASARAVLGRTLLGVASALVGLRARRTLGQIVAREANGGAATRGPRAAAFLVHVVGLAVALREQGRVVVAPVAALAVLDVAPVTANVDNKGFDEWLPGRFGFCMRLLGECSRRHGYLHSRPSNAPVRAWAAALPICARKGVSER